MQIGRLLRILHVEPQKPPVPHKQQQHRQMPEAVPPSRQQDSIMNVKIGWYIWETAEKKWPFVPRQVPALLYEPYLVDPCQLMRFYCSLDVALERAAATLERSQNPVCIAPALVWGELKQSATEINGLFARRIAQVAVLSPPGWLEKIAEDPSVGESALRECFEEIVRRINCMQIRIFLHPADRDRMEAFFKDSIAKAQSRTEIPAVATPVVGWRMWRILTGPGAAPCLASLNQDIIWPAAEPLRARHSGAAMSAARLQPSWCWDDQMLAFPEAFGHCACGIYAYDSPERTAEDLGRIASTEPLLCAGAVALCGVVFCHENGYRAQFAYPQQPLLVFGPEETSRTVAAELSQRYGVRFIASRDPAVRRDRQARRLLAVLKSSGAVRRPLGAPAPARWLARLVAAPAAVYRRLESSRRKSA
jgi:hypothetical protein